MQQEKRDGRFTSSENWRLMTKGRKDGEPGAQYYSYIEEVALEIAAGRTLEDNTPNQAMRWGKYVEKFARERISKKYGLNYDPVNGVFVEHQTLWHPEKELLWAGTPDGDAIINKEQVVFEIKCPWTMLSHCQACISKNVSELCENHTSGTKWYWQIVSNAVLTGASKGILCVYTPSPEELEVIIGSIEDLEMFSDEYMGAEFIYRSFPARLPHHDRSNGSPIPNLYCLEFQIDSADAQALKDRVRSASELALQLAETYRKSLSLIQNT